MEPVVHLRAAVSLLGRFPALAGVDLDVQPGEILLVQGPNGAGKTTLLRTCAGLLPVVSGEACVLGFDLQDRADRRAVRRHVGLLGHATGLYDDLTVADNVRFWAKAGGATTAEADAAMTALGVDGRLAAVRVAKLSARQRPRTSSAAMVARRPVHRPVARTAAGPRGIAPRGTGAAPRPGAGGSGVPLPGPGAAAPGGSGSLIRQAGAAGPTLVRPSRGFDRAESRATEIVHLAGGTVI